MPPYVVCVIGKKNSGKTALAVALIAELVSRGYRVMSVKHGHGFDLDRPGTDSWRHRQEGGAERVLLAGPGEVALLGAWGPAGEPDLDALVHHFLLDAEIVVAEGYKAGPWPKIEVYRAAAHPEPVYDPGHPFADSFLAIVTDRDDFEAPVPVHPLSGSDTVRRLGDLVEMERSSRAGASPG